MRRAADSDNKCPLLACAPPIVTSKLSDYSIFTHMPPSCHPFLTPITHAAFLTPITLTELEGQEA